MPIPGLTIEPESAVPVYRQIADGVLAAAREGRLKPGHRLPATRDLARELGVNRQTVVTAYEQLQGEGWVESHTGKGTFLVEPAPAGGEQDEGEALNSFSRAVEGPNVAGLLSVYQAATASDGISFAGSYPSRELMPVEAFGEAVTLTLREQGHEALTYGPTAGHPPLRELLAAKMRERGSRVEPENLLVTNGAQQAIELIFHTFLERGDAVLIEEPTYTGALSVLGSIGARVVAVPVDDQGMRPDLLAIALERHRPRLLYVQPSFHNPTTAVMGEERRRRLLELAARSRTIVVEDDWAWELRFEGKVPRTLHALDEGAQVIYLSTFSKMLMPGLRVGWIASPPAVTERLMRLKQIRDCGTSPLLQASLHAFLSEGALEQHLARVLPAYRERRDCMLAALERHFPAEASWSRPEGGLFVWVRLPRGIDGQELVLEAQRRGVRYSNGDLFHSNADGSHTLRLTYSAASPAEIESGVKTLGELVRARRPAGREAPRRPTETLPIL
jgi:GntR family transcriptional regulator/MocR family aminotransferase